MYESRTIWPADDFVRRKYWVGQFVQINMMASSNGQFNVLRFCFYHTVFTDFQKENFKEEFN